MSIQHRRLQAQVDEKKARIAQRETELAEARKQADYWDAENGRMIELCRQKLGKRDVHGVADGIEQLALRWAEARKDGERLDWLARRTQWVDERMHLGLRGAIDAARGAK